MLISVIIPSYNRASSVSQTIDSIINQSVRAGIEIIIGDDCSTDNARDVLLAYKQRYPDIIQLIFHEQNLGLGANWATCVKASKGTYICNCDNDDYWHNPDKLQIQLDYMESHPEANVLITDHRCHNRTTGIITEEKAVIDRTVPIQQSIYGSPKTRFCNATIMYRACFLKTHINLDDFISRRLSLQDWPAWVILAANTDFDHIPVSTATFGIETESITRPKSIANYAARLDRDEDCVRYISELFPDKFFYSKEDWQNKKNKQLMHLAFKLHDYKSAHEYGLKAQDANKIEHICSRNHMMFGLYCLLSTLNHKVF